MLLYLPIPPLVGIDILPVSGRWGGYEEIPPKAPNGCLWVQKAPGRWCLSSSNGIGPTGAKALVAGRMVVDSSGMSIRGPSVLQCTHFNVKWNTKYPPPLV